MFTARISARLRSAVLSLGGALRRPLAVASLSVLGAVAALAVPTTPVITAASPVTSGKAGLTATTTNQTGVTFTWSFSPATGGTITTGQGTNSITYTAGPVGTYTLSCQASDASANTATGSKSISVIAAPVAPTITTGNSNETQVTASTASHTASIAAQTGMTYTWSIVDGTVTAGAGTTAITYTAGGTSGAAALKLTCTVKNAANDTAATTRTLDVIAAPNGAITLSNSFAATLTTVTSGNTGLTASVVDQPGSTYLWTPTNAAIDSGAGTRAITWHPTATSGTVSFSCKVTNSLGANVTGTKSATIVINPANAVITTAADITEGSATHNISATSISGATYAWQPTAGVAYASGTAVSTNYTTTATNGTANASAVVLGLSCLVKNQDGVQATISKNVNVWAAPTVPVVVTTQGDGTTPESQVSASSAGHKAHIAPQNNATYSWAVTDGTISLGQGTTEITFTAGAVAGTAALKATCTVTNKAGTAVSGFATEDVIAAPNATITVAKGTNTGLSSITAGNTGIVASVPAQAGSTYTWTVTGATPTAGGGTNSTNNSVTFTDTTAAGGTVTIAVTVTNSVGVSANGSKNLTVLISPGSATLTTAVNITEGGASHSIAATSIVGAAYAWQPTTGVTYAAGTGVSTSYTTTVTNGTGNTSAAVIGLSCKITNPDGATGTVTKNVNVWALPAAPVVVTTTNDGTTPESQVTANTAGHKANVAAAANTTYTWGLTNASLTAGAGTTQITFTAGATVGANALVVTCTAANPAGGTTPGSASESVFAAPSNTITAFKGTATNLTYVTAGNVGLQAKVTDLGAGATYVWSATGANITAGQGTSTITFTDTAAAGGTVALSVTSTNAVGATASPTKNLTVVASPGTAVITTAADITEGPTASHTISVTGISGATFAWQPTAGVTYTSSTVSSTSYKTTATNGTGNVSAATFTVSCKVTNQDGATSTRSKSVNVWAAPAVPVVVTTANDGTTPESQVTASTTGHKAHTTAQPNSTYAWTVTNGTITAGQGTTEITFSAGATAGTGNLVVTCKVYNLAGTFTSGNSAEDIIAAPVSTITVSKGAASNLASVTATNTGLTAAVPVQAGATYAWSVLSGATITSPSLTGSSVTFNVTAPAGQTVKLQCIVQNSLGASSTGSKTLTVNAVPAPVISTAADISYDSAGTATHAASVVSVAGATYAWTLTSSDLAHGVTPSSATTYTLSYKTAAVAGSTITLQCTVTTADGVASAPASKSVTVDSLPTALAITAPSTVTAGQSGLAASVDPTGTFGLIFNWTTSTGITVNTGGTSYAMTFTAGGNGTASLKCRISNKAGATTVVSTKSVTINPNSAMTVSKTTATAGTTISASVPSQSNVSYLWSFVGGTGSISTGQGTNAVTLNVGTSSFTLQCLVASTTNATSSTGSQAITVVAAPSITSFTNGGAIVVGGTGSLNAVFTTDGTATIDQNVGTVTSGVSAPVSPRTNTTYTLTVTNSAGATATAQTTVTVNPGFYATGNTMQVGNKTGHTSTLLENGTVLIAGGKDGANLSSNSADLFTANATDGNFAATGNMVTARSGHAAARLPNGKVMIIGGVNASGTTLATCELYSAGTFTSVVASMSSARRGHTATVTPDGKILIVGGQDNSNLFTNKIEVTDGTSIGVRASLLATPRTGHTATLMANGKVLIFGGISGSTGLATDKFQIYDPASGSLSAEGTAPAARAGHTATLLPDGKVLIFGGYDASNALATTAMEFDSGSNTFGAPFQNGLSAFAARKNHSATLLPGGKVLIAGGNDGSSDLATAELFDYQSLSSTTLPNMSGTRSFQAETLLNTSTTNYSKVLLSGGFFNGSVTNTGVMFDLAPVSPTPTIVVFAASKTTITAGTSTTLYPVFLGGTGTITGGASPINAVSGRAVTVTPAGVAGNQITYTLTVGAVTKTIVISLI